MHKILLNSVLVFSISALSYSGYSQAQDAVADNAAKVLKTEQKLKRVVNVLVNINKRVKKLEKKNTSLLNQIDQLKASGGGDSDSEDGAIDLSDEDESLAGSVPETDYAPGKIAPNLMIYFDLVLYARPNDVPEDSLFTFDNFHNFILLEYTPSAKIQFSTEIRAAPRYFQLGYQFAEKAQLRIGKIWIPFDDAHPHRIYGGKTNVSRIALDKTFLPDLWADLGIGLKYDIVQRLNFELVAHAYIVNGFQDGGTDPLGQASAALGHPSFSGESLSTIADNNKNKSWGGRAHALMGKTIGFGTSFFTGQWNDESDTEPARFVTAIAADAQMKLGSRANFRTGAARMVVDLTSSSSDTDFTRLAYYFELSYKFGRKRDLKLVLRNGGINLDDRVVDANDQAISGFRLLYKPNLIEWSVGYDVDAKINSTKSNRKYGEFRVVARF